MPGEIFAIVEDAIRLGGSLRFFSGWRLGSRENHYTLVLRLGIGRIFRGCFGVENHVMAYARADAGRSQRHPDAFAVVLLDLAAAVEGLVDRYIDQMQRRALFIESGIINVPIAGLADVVAGNRVRGREVFWEKPALV